MIWAPKRNLVIPPRARLDRQRGFIMTPYQYGGAGGGGGGSGYSAEVLSDSPFGYWKMDESSGDLADSGSSGATMPVFGPPTYGEPAVFTGAGPAIRWAGSSNCYLAVPPGGYVYTGDLSIEVLVKFPVAPTGTQNLIGLGASGETSSTNVILQCGFSGVGVGMFHERGSGTNDGSTVAYSFAANTPYHVVMVRDTTALTHSLYINASLVGSVAYAGNPTGGSLSHLTIARNPTANSEYFQAWLQHLAHFKQKLSPSRIAAHYAALF